MRACLECWHVRNNDIPASMSVASKSRLWNIDETENIRETVINELCKQK